MDTTLPWGFGIYECVIPALSLPAFLILLVFRVRILSRVFWILTAFNSIAWCLGDWAATIAVGRAYKFDIENVGMVLNLFSLLYIVISAIVQFAAHCEDKRLVEHPVTQHE
jgi:Na+-transporting methylmalonyl-CoA/oxaloacetate decarboxylase gamma subunit